MLAILKKLGSMVAMLLLLTSCGFMPRSLNSLPPQLTQVYYQTEHPYEPFELNFTKRLKATGVKFLLEPHRGAPIINIAYSYSYSTSNPNIISTQARIYDLKYTATVTVSDFYQQPLLPPQMVEVTQSVTLQPNEVFEATPQIAIIRQEMQQELTIKILNILSAPQTFQALKKLSK